ncbi:AraC family transcriptional regulator [Corynebacterium pacaense]|uniref:AraC family transcriptional regulator n=1 Tax=Corynebacterium pacaense TaxID=1816684 RepID=UPI0009B9EDA3|nr:helix-turn-helix transcriptional regulator [Corynebacterium pacaense]
MSRGSLLWCQSGVHTVKVGGREVDMVAGDLLFAGDQVAHTRSAGGIVLDIRFPECGIAGETRRIHLGQAWGEWMIHEYSRSLMGEAAPSTEILRLFREFVTAPRLPFNHEARSVARTLVNNPADNTGLEEFARRMGVAARTLQRQFVKGTGYTFSEWRAAQRVSVAASLLAHDFSISVTANLVGFAATSSLTRAFRRHTGRTPSAFTTGSIGMGMAGDPPAIPPSISFALSERDQQLWIHSGSATVTTPGFCRFLAQGDMATIPAGTRTRIDVAAGSIALPVPLGMAERDMDLRTLVEIRSGTGGEIPRLTLLEQAEWEILSHELLTTPVPVHP